MTELRIGIDLGGTKIAGVVLDRSGEVRHADRVATPREDYDATLAALCSMVESLDVSARALAGDVGPCPVGIGTPGAWVAERRVMKNCNSTWLNGRPLLDDLAARLGARVRLANDANCFALSEARAGAARDAAVVFGVILGTGVGGGWVVRGELVTGANGVAGEWGHTPLPYFRGDTLLRAHDAALADLEDRLDDRACYCGRTNCVETFLSGPGLVKTHQALFGESVAAEVIARADDDRRAATLDLYAAQLGRSLAQMANVLDPDVIVLGGGVSNVERLYDRVPVHVRRYGFTLEGRTRIVPAAHGDDSGVRGAAWLNP